MMTAPDYSIKTVNTNILNLLNDAGIDGLLVDDIVKSLGYNAKKDIAPRLRDLRGRGEIKEVGGRWKKIEKKCKKNACSEEFPRVSLPGDEKFVSYKNTLQEYCQKKGFSVPHYSAKRGKDGLYGTVSYSDKLAHSKNTCSNPKEAQARAAFEALQQLGYLGVNDKFEISSANVCKRKSSENDSAVRTTAIKQFKAECSDPPFKDRLIAYAKKKQISLPEYNTVPVAGGFFSSVCFNDKQFKGISVCPNHNDAEQSAAKAALDTFLGDSLVDKEAPVVTPVVSSEVQVSHPGVFKNKLQEFCMKTGKGMPFYQTEENSSDKTFRSTVTIQHMQFTGPFAKRKKDAEGKAAEEALKDLNPKI